MSDRPRGRGGARGRGTPSAPSQPPQQRGPAPAQQAAGPWGGGRPQQQAGGQGAWGSARPPQQPSSAGPPAPGATWGPRPGGIVGVPQQRPQHTKETAGRAATHHRPERIAEQLRSIDIGGAGDAAASLGAAGQSRPPQSGSGRGTTSRMKHNVIVENFRTRPQHATTKCGTSGQSLRLLSNYFEIVRRADWCLYHYKVDFAPEEDSTGIRKRLLIPHAKRIKGYIFDGSSLFSSYRLERDPMELFSDHPIRNTPVKIDIRLVGELKDGDAHYFQFFNIIMRKCLSHLKLQLVGRNYFDAIAKIDIRDYRMELWPGYITSIRQHERNVLMCVEIIHKVMRRDTVHDLLRQCYHDYKSDAKKVFEREIIGSVILTDYNNKTYRVDDVDWNTTPQQSFEKRDSSKITYKEYFKQRYNLNIQDMGQPMLISKPKLKELRFQKKEVIYLVPELCRLTGLSDSQRSDFNLMRALAEHTRMVPEGRIDRANRFLNRITGNEECMTVMKSYDLQFAKNLIELAGRVMQNETIFWGGDKKVKVPLEADWTKELRNGMMPITSTINNWSIICPSFLSQSAFDFMKCLCQAAAGMKFNLPRPKLCQIPDDRIPTYLSALERVISQDKPQCIFCVVSNNKSDRYSAIKKMCCIDRPVPTQVFAARTFRVKNPLSVATKVAIQINCKMGGAAWHVHIPLAGLMVIGFDVCHDTSDKSKSYGAMVASLNSTCSQYFSTCSPHGTGEELSSDISVNVTKAIHKYREVNSGQLPQRIVIYRDGVGDGQIPQVYKNEVVKIKEKLQEFYSGDQPLKMAFIIVSKRINTRFFTPQGQNPPPGTVVDDIVTLPERYDFFIVSQHTRQGTVSPTSYNVIEDTTGFPPDNLQRLTYKFCHMYFNWSGTVRVPAPCQYAHKLASLVGQSLHRSPSNQLSTCLYFL